MQWVKCLLFWHKMWQALCKKSAAILGAECKHEIWVLFLRNVCRKWKWVLVIEKNCNISTNDVPKLLRCCLLKHCQWKHVSSSQTVHHSQRNMALTTHVIVCLKSLNNHWGTSDISVSNGHKYKNTHFYKINKIAHHFLFLSAFHVGVKCHISKVVKSLPNGWNNTQQEEKVRELSWWDVDENTVSRNIYVKGAFLGPHSPLVPLVHILHFK